MDAELPGWEAPVFQAMTTPVLSCGVPLIFFAADALGTLFLALLLGMLVHLMAGVSVILLGALLFGIAWVGTKIEPRWLSMLVECLTYQREYEG
jgi:type IV secretory pathway TrbD component